MFLRNLGWLSTDCMTYPRRKNSSDFKKVLWISVLHESDDSRGQRDHCWQINLQAKTVLSVTGACSAIWPHSVTSISDSGVTILVTRNIWNEEDAPFQLLSCSHWKAETLMVCMRTINGSNLSWNKDYPGMFVFFLDLSSHLQVIAVTLPWERPRQFLDGLSVVCILFSGHRLKAKM
jgi:hypothetical protein